MENQENFFYIIRHAQSKYNITEAEETAKGTEEKDFKFREDLIDCPITDFGKSQTESAAKEMESIDVGLVLVSPLRRTLMTAYEIFRNHPSKPDVVVCPKGREMCFSSCDVPSDIELLRKEFPFDFSAMDTFEDKECWIAETFADKETRDILQKLKESIQPGENRVETFGKLINKYMADRYPNEYLEKVKSLQERCRSFGKELIEKAKTMKNGKKLVFVGHNILIINLYSTMETDDREPQDGIRLKNCEVRKISF